MNRPGARGAARHLLLLCEQADQLAQRVRRSTRATARGRLEGRRKAAVKALQKALRTRSKDRLHEALAVMAKGHTLEGRDVLALLFLFNRRVRSQDAIATGREIVEACALDEDEALAASVTLHPDHPLVAKGLVETGAACAEEALDSPFRLAESCFTTLYRAYHGLPEITEPTNAPAYRSGREHLADWRILVEIARRRALRLFPRSGWADGLTPDDIGLPDLQDGFLRVVAAIRAREDATQKEVPLPIRDLSKEFGLDHRETLVLVTLLVQELYTSRVTVDLLDLVRLIADEEDDVPHWRRALSADGRLRSLGLINTETEFEDRDLFGTAWLPESVAERFLAGQDGTGPISPDEKTRFKDWLASMNGSRDFFDRMGPG